MTRYLYESRFLATVISVVMSIIVHFPYVYPARNAEPSCTLRIDTGRNISDTKLQKF